MLDVRLNQILVWIISRKSKINNTIWKYILAVETVQEIEMPVGSIILTAQTQENRRGDNDLCLWVLVNKFTDRTVNRIIEVYGTGESMTGHDRHYIGSAQMPGLVWHVFERFNAVVTD